MENRQMNLLAEAYTAAIVAERALGLTETPRLSTPILKERVKAGEKLNLQFSYHPSSWGSEPLAPLEAPYLRLAEPEKLAEWKAGDYLSGDADLLIQFVAHSGPYSISGIVVQPGLTYYTPGEIFDGFGASYFTPYTPTPDERIRFDRIVANAKLKAEWDKKPFPVQAWNHTAEPFAEWHDIAGDINWSAAHLTYRRKPEPRFVPWTAEDARKVRDIWVRRKLVKDDEYRFGAIGAKNVHLICWGPLTFALLFANFEQLDGTPCGKKEVAE